MGTTDELMSLNGQRVRLLPHAVAEDNTVNFGLIDRHLRGWSNRRKERRFLIYKETVLALLDRLQSVDGDVDDDGNAVTGCVELDRPSDLIDHIGMFDDEESMDFWAERLMGDIPHYLARRYTRALALKCFGVDLDELKEGGYNPELLSGDVLRSLTFERRGVLVYCLQILMTLLFGTNKVSDDSMFFNEDIITWYD